MRVLVFSHPSLLTTTLPSMTNAIAKEPTRASHHEAIGHEPTTSNESGGATFKDVWENKRVLAFCQFSGPPKLVDKMSN